MLLDHFKKIAAKRQSHVSKQSSFQQPDAETPEYKVQQIHSGQEEGMRNRFITDYQPYVAQITSRFCKRYIDSKRDDEFSIALTAFNEAINQYAPDKGRSFLGFAETVIRRRLIDYIRGQQKHRQQIPYSAFDTEDEEHNIVNPIETHQAMEGYEREHTIEARRQEILDFNGNLSRFGIAFAELAETSPRHLDTRQSLLRIGRLMANDDEIMAGLMNKRMLPIKELLVKVDISRKTLERHRKFLITIALIYNGPYFYLQDYIQIPEVERSEKDE